MATGENDPNLTYEQLRDVRDQLKSPLTGRSVLVPYGSKAFFPGRLVDESVTVCTKSGERKEIARTEALDVLQSEMDDLYRTSKKQTQQPRKSALKKKSAEPKPAPSPTMSQAASPYFEIREEIDDDGKEIGSEAINVTKHLEYLRSNPDIVDGDTLPPQVQPGNDQVPIEQIPVENELKQLSDPEYDALSERLEELAKLEEASDEEKVTNVKSSKKLQSKGWSKGFFNKSSKKKKSTTIVPPAGTSKVTFKDNVAEKAMEMKPVPKPVAPPKPIDSSVFSGVIQERKSKQAVSFDGEKNKVREIPRVGQTSVRDIQRPSSGRPANVPTAAEQPKKKLSRFAMERQQGLL